MDQITRRAFGAAGFGLLLATSATFAQQQSSTVRVRGTVEEADGLMLTVKSRDGQTTYKQLSSCRREIADRFGRVKAGASRPRTPCGYGLDSAKSLSATATVRSTRCADRCNGRPKPYRRGAWR
jgi:hypothetical protein